MADPVITVHDSGGTEIVAAITLPTATPGTPTAATAVSIRNDDAGTGAVDPLRNGRLSVLARPAGSFAEPVASGLQYLDDRACQVRITAASGGATATPTGWRAIGAGKSLALGEIPDGGILSLELRTDASLPAALADVELFFAIESRRSTPLPDGAYETLGNFVDDGARGAVPPDPDFAEVYSIAGALAADSPEDDSVDVWTEVVYYLAGQRLVYTGTEEVFTATDGDAATLASGEAYYAALSLDSAGGLTVTKGSKATAPLDDTDRPTPPADDILAGWVTVPFGLVITTVESVLALGFFGLEVVSGLQVRIGGGRGAVGGSWVHSQTPTSATLADDSDLEVYVTPSGGLEIVAAGTGPTDGRSMLIWEVTTASGAVTVITDRRRIGTVPRAGQLYQAVHSVGAPSGGAVTVAVQLADGIGRPIARAAAVEWYLADDAAGLVPSTTAPDGGVAAGTDGALIEYVANLSGRMISEVDGDVDVAVSESTAGTWYLVVVVDGRLYISGAITPT